MMNVVCRRSAPANPGSGGPEPRKLGRPQEFFWSGTKPPFPRVGWWGWVGLSWGAHLALSVVPAAPAPDGRAPRRHRANREPSRAMR